MRVGQFSFHTSSIYKEKRKNMHFSWLQKKKNKKKHYSEKRKEKSMLSRRVEKSPRKAEHLKERVGQQRKGGPIASTHVPY